MPKNNKIYWAEGVTEKEVKSLLSNENSKFSWLRRQRNRRFLVFFMAIGIVMTGLGSYYPDLKQGLGLDGGSEIIWLIIAVLILLFAVLVGYSLLRIAVRGIADAPTELLDERQVRIRDTSFRTAYQIAGYLILVLFLLLSFGPDLTLFSDSGNDGSFLLIATLFAYASLPSMVLAWREGDI
ncbi:MAG: hypothetical protein RL288_412 [Actinomycetota bacterium]